MKTFYWLVKREFWEHRGGFVWAPLITSAIFLLLNLIGIVAGETISGHHGFSAFINIDGNHTQLFNQPMDAETAQRIGAGLDLAMYVATLIISVVFGFVAFFYFLGALYDDRRDRSLLFWKSLPISDTATVLSKVVATGVVAPVISLVVGVATGMVVLLMFTITLSLHGIGVWHLLTLAHPLRVTANLLGSIPLYLLWALPSIGWLLLCSAWARSKPFLWAVLLPVIVSIMVGWFRLLDLLPSAASTAWGTACIRMLLSVFPGGWLIESIRSSSLNHDDDIGMSFIDLSHTYGILASANLWIGACAGIAMIAAAIWFRRWRDDT